MLGLGFQATWLLLIQCTFILATATLIGSISMLPGGLGAADSSIGGLLLVSIKGINNATASAATLLIRFCTLWFGVTLGIITLFVFHKRFERGSQKISPIQVESSRPQTESARLF